MSALDAELSQIERLAIDSAPIIYFMEEHPRYVALVENVFRRIDSGHITAVSSTLTLTEVLTKPLQSGEKDLRDRYLARISHTLSSRGRRDACQCGLSTKVAPRRACSTLQAPPPGERPQ